MTPSVSLNRFPSEADVAALAQRLEGDVEHWDHENADGAGGDHAGKYWRADTMTADLRRSLGDDKGINPQNKRERSHHHRSEPHLRPQHCGFADIFALFALVLCELNNKNAVLRR